MAEPNLKLRGHHLLCMLTYIGRGYTPAFTENYNALAARVTASARTIIDIVQGPDDICGGFSEKCESCAHCYNTSTAERDVKALRDIGNALQMPLQIGAQFEFTKETTAQLRKLFSGGDIRSACTGCEWHSLCTSIAAGGYKEVKVSPL